MIENTLSGICGAIAVIIQILVSGLKYERWRPRLESLVVTFMCGALLPTGIALFSFALFEVPKIDITQYKINLAIAGIVLVYIAIHGIIKETIENNNNK